MHHMMSRSEKFRLIIRAILYIIAVTLYCMFREFKHRAMAALPALFNFKHTLLAFSSTTAYQQYPPPPFTPSTTSMANTHIFMVDGSPSLTPIPNHILTKAINLTLPTIRYGDFLLNQKHKDSLNNDDGSCVVCWECVDRSDQIRDLPNCRHVFHGECLDRWVDQGQITCPLCRSLLLSPLTNPWAVVRQSKSQLEQEQEAEPEPEAEQQQQQIII